MPERRLAVFHPEFLQDLRFWVKNDRRIALRALDLVEALRRHRQARASETPSCRRLVAPADRRAPHCLFHREGSRGFSSGPLSLLGLLRGGRFLPRRDGDVLGRVPRVQLETETPGLHRGIALDERL